MNYEEMREKILEEIAEEKARIRTEKKAKREFAQTVKDAMTVEQKIRFVNTPYKDMPDALKEGMTHRPQMFNFVRYTKPHIGRQKETFAARLIRYRDKYNLTEQGFCDICNEFAQKYDLPATKDQRAQRTRITLRDIHNYENFNVCPKIDKMTIIAEAMGVGIDYFGGYGATERKSNNQILEAKYRKRRKKDDSDRA